ncbi:MAG TPA: hypothetical protein VMS22_13405 [Candidatus Eisenbacteria bacterium]|nr:hypothetical protein [Candidatus Eisenbacteria bacterium]
MSEARGIAATLHDTIDEVTSTVEGIHKSVAELPLDVLAEITPLKHTFEELKVTQNNTIEAVYGLIRKVNDRVRRLTTGDDE